MRKIIALAVALAVFPAISAQQIWFAPNNTDMLNNNARDAEWSQTRDNVAVFKFYYGRCEQVPDMRSSYSSGAHPRGTS